MHWAWREKAEHWRGLMNREDCCTTDLHFANKLKQLLCAWGVRECGRTGGEEEERESKNEAQCAAPFQIWDILHSWDDNMCSRVSNITTLISLSSSSPCSEIWTALRSLMRTEICHGDVRHSTPALLLLYRRCGTFKSALIFINTLLSLLAWELKYSTRTKKWCSAGWSKEPLQLSCSLHQRQLPI